MPGSSEYLIQKHQFLDFWGKTIWGNYGKRVKPEWERRVSNRWNHIRKRLRPKLSTSQIWTLINNFVLVLACAKCSKLITLEENTTKVQQLPLNLPLLFAFSSEVRNSGKSMFFLTSGFDSVSIVIDSLSVSRRPAELYFSHSI